MSHSHSILTAMHSSYINISLFALSLKLIQAAPRLYFCNCDKSCFPSGSCSFQRGLISQVTVLPSFKLESHQTIAGPITDGLYMKHVYNRHAKCQDGNIFLRLFVFPCALFYACVSFICWCCFHLWLFGPFLKMCCSSLQFILYLFVVV